MGSVSERRERIIDYILNNTLYTKFVLDEDDFKYLSDLLTVAFSFRCYCVICKDDSIFETTKKERSKQTSVSILTPVFSMDETEPQKKQYRSNKMEKFASDYPFAVLTAFCASCRATVKFYFLVKNDFIMKIGQYPSIRDLGIKEISKYRNLLQNKYNDYDEFCAALHIFASGAAVGAFVYLRRILEHLLIEAHQNASKQSGWDEEKFKNSRYEVKIKMLKNEFPEYTFECLPSLYKILSKGIHDFSEDECLEKFDLMRDVIISILEEKQKKKDANRVQKSLKKSLNKVRSEI